MLQKLPKDTESVTSMEVEPEYLKSPKKLKLNIDFKIMVELPHLVDENEWLATHTVGLFHNVNNLLEVMSEICTAETCPTMNGPYECVFNWQDDRGKSIRVTAPQYFDFAMTWCQQRITNQEIFPTKFGDQFPFDYLINVKQIIEFIWVIICHIYHSHYVQIIELNVRDQLQMIFLHIFNLAEKYKLLPLDQLCKLQPLYDTLDKDYIQK